jgi:general secretion pathway protein J
MQLVAWTLRSGRLYRWEGPTVQTVAALEQSFQRSQQLQSLEGAQLKTLEGLAGWQLFYYRGNGWSNAMSSDDVQPASAAPVGPGASAPGPARAVLPTGIRMVLQFGAGSGFNGPLTRQIVMGPQQ